MTITGSGDAHQRAYDERVRAERAGLTTVTDVTADAPESTPAPVPDAPEATRPTSRKKPGTTSTTGA